MIIMEMMIVTMRSIVGRWLDSFWWFDSFSPITIIKPDTASIKLCVASDVIAIDPDNNPAMIFIMPSTKFVRIKI